jgi:hypothetical protein
MTHRFITCFLLVLLFYACKPDKLDADISKVDIKKVEALRLEEDIFSITPATLQAKTKSNKSKYGEFYEHYIMNLLRIDGTQDSSYATRLLSFVNDQDVRTAYNHVQKLYGQGQFEKLLPEINDCVKRFKFHFPERKLPTRVITCISGWNYSFAYTDSALVIGLDMYLGDTSIFYQMLQLPQFRTRYMNGNYIVSDLARGWMISEFDNTNPTNTLLHHTVFYGKIYYATNALLPELSDSVLMNYTSKQMRYCKQYEKKLWGFFAEKNKLFETNIKTIQELTTDGPFTGAISKECPPRIAMWVGLQIVRSYMKNNDVSLEQLMNESDAQKILNKSKYRP